MGFTGTAFGILIKKHGDDFDIIKLVARQVWLYRNGKCLGGKPGTNYRDLIEKHSWNEDTYITLELYDDIEGPTKIDTPYEEWGFESDVFSFKQSSLSIGNPTTCGVMIYAASTVDDFVSVEPETMLELTTKLEELTQCGRIPVGAQIGLQVNCCS